MHIVTHRLHWKPYAAIFSMLASVLFIDVLSKERVMLIITCIKACSDFIELLFLDVSIFML